MSDLDARQNLRRDYIWNLIGVLAQNAISPLLLIFVTHVNGINDSGLFSYAFSLAVILWALGMWGGRTFQVSDIKREFSHRNYIVGRLVLAIVMLVLAAAFSFLNGYDRTKTSVIVALTLFKAIESVADALYGVLQAHGRLYLSGRSLLYKAISGFLAFVVIDIVSKNILLASLGIAVVNVLIMFAYELRLAGALEDIKVQASEFARDIRYAARMVHRTAPVFAVVFLSMFTLNIPRYFVDRYDQAHIGYFGILAMPITLIGLLMSFVLQPNVVHLSHLVAQRKYVEFQAIVRKLILSVMGIGAVVLAGAALVGVPVLGLVFGVDFSAYKTVLIVIVAGAVLNAFVSIFINVLTILRRFKAQFYVLLLSNAILVVISMGIVTEHHLLGAVWLFTVANVVQVVLLAWGYRGILRRASSAIE